MFRWDLNELKLLRDRMDSGNLFQTDGAQQLKACLPNSDDNAWASIGLYTPMHWLFTHPIRPIHVHNDVLPVKSWWSKWPQWIQTAADEAPRRPPASSHLAEDDRVNAGCSDRNTTQSVTRRYGHAVAADLHPARATICTSNKLITQMKCDNNTSIGNV